VRIVPITQACPHLIAQLRRLGDGIVAGFGFALAGGACFAARSASWLVADRLGRRAIEGRA
jgi:hypothetical protein